MEEELRKKNWRQRSGGSTEPCDEEELAAVAMEEARNQATEDAWNQATTEPLLATVEEDVLMVKHVSVKRGRRFTEPRTREEAAGEEEAIGEARFCGHSGG